AQNSVRPVVVRSPKEFPNPIRRERWVGQPTFKSAATLVCQLGGGTNRLAVKLAAAVLEWPLFGENDAVNNALLAVHLADLALEANSQPFRLRRHILQFHHSVLQVDAGSLLVPPRHALLNPA